MSRFIDLTGQRFGRLTVLNRSKDNVYGEAAWYCLCDCGRSAIVRSSYLRSGWTKSCGCISKEVTSMRSKKYNSFRVVGNIAFVQLSNTEEEMCVDLNVWEHGASNYCWCLNGYGYASAYIYDKRKRMVFHNYAFPDCPPGKCVDHKNGNRIDNRRENIRFVTIQQNNQNKGTRNKSKSGCNGVVWDKRRRKWRAQIGVHKKNIYLGRFENIDDAIAARKAAEIKYFGEYRRKDHTD